MKPSSRSKGIAAGTFDELAAATMTKASRQRARKRADTILPRMTLDELRKACKVTQLRLATAMQIQQSEVSRIEQRGELKLGTIRDYVRALGGHLEVRAVFPDRNVEIAFTSE